MPGFQPEIVVMDGFYQNGLNPLAVGAQHIRENLIPCQGAVLRRNTVLIQTLADSLGKGLFGMGDAGNVILAAEFLYPALFAVGHHTKGNFR